MKKKILHIIPCFVPGGAETLAMKYYENLDPNKFEVYLASGVEDGPLRERIVDQSRLFVGSRRNDGGRLGVWRRLARYTRELKPDLIHTHLLSGDSFGFVLSRRLKCPWVSTQHNVEFNTPWLRRMLWARFLRHADRVIAVSKAVADYAQQNFHITGKNLLTIPNGIELKEWVDVPLSDYQGERDLRLGIVGRLEEQKGHVYLLRGLARALDFPWELTVFGEGSREKELKVLAEKLGISERIEWAGAVANLPQRLAHIDALIQPSLWEGLSLAVMEGMAAGRALAVSKPAGAELINDGRNGLIIPMRSEEAVEQAVRFLTMSPRETRRLGAAARRTALDNFSLEKNIKAVEGVYEKLL